MENTHYGIIYKATNTLNKKVYIGQTVQPLTERKSAHAYRAKKGDRRTAFCIAILEHGFSSFSWEQIDQAGTQEELDAKERKWITSYDSMNPAKGYNSTDGGTYGIINAEARKKISESKKGENNPMFGKHPSEETKRKMSESHKGRIMSPETRRKISEAKKGKPNGWQGRRHTEESNQKNREAHIKHG